MQQRHKLQEFVRQYKNANPCKDCGRNFPYYVMDFDHCKGKKTNNINEITKRNLSFAKLQNELKKCELVCSNCHRVRTHKRTISEKDNHVTFRR